MTPTLYYLLCAVLSVAVLLGISMMSRVKTAVRGNLLSAVSLFAGIRYADLQRNCLGMEHLSLHGRVVIEVHWPSGKMIEMPQMVALLNGVEVGLGPGNPYTVGRDTPPSTPLFTNVTAILAVEWGVITLSEAW